MEKDYSFEKFWEDLDNGFQIYYTYMECRYLVYKMTKKQLLLQVQQKTEHHS